MSTFKVEVRRFRAGDDAELLRRGVRESDRKESFKVSGLSVAESLPPTLGLSLVSGSVFVDGAIVCLFGVGSHGPLSDTGMPWLIAHEDFERRETAPVMMRISRRMVRQWLTVFPRLENLADPENRASLRYLSGLGFTFDRSDPAFGPHGHELVRFWRNHVRQSG